MVFGNYRENISIWTAYNHPKCGLDWYLHIQIIILVIIIILLIIIIHYNHLPSAISHYYHQPSAIILAIFIHRWVHINHCLFSTNSKRIQIFTTSDPGWKNFIPKNPKFYYLGPWFFSTNSKKFQNFTTSVWLEITWFSDRTATLIPGMRCPLLECTYISGRTAALILGSLELLIGWPIPY